MFDVEDDALVGRSAKRLRGSAPEEECELHLLLAQKGQRNGALRAEAERRAAVACNRARGAGSWHAASPELLVAPPPAPRRGA